MGGGCCWPEAVAAAAPGTPPSGSAGQHHAFFTTLPLLTAGATITTGTHRFPSLCIQKDQNEAVGKLLVQNRLKSTDAQDDGVRTREPASAVLIRLARFWAAHARPSHQILDAAVIEVSAAVREAVQKDFDETLVPGWTHG